MKPHLVDEYAAECRSCTFYSSDYRSQEYCRRYPPVAVADPDGGIESGFPTTEGDEYCGEYYPTQGKIDAEAIENEEDES